MDSSTINVIVAIPWSLSGRMACSDTSTMWPFNSCVSAVVPWSICEYCRYFLPPLVHAPASSNVNLHVRNFVVHLNLPTMTSPGHKMKQILFQWRAGKNLDVQEKSNSSSHLVILKLNWLPFTHFNWTLCEDAPINGDISPNRVIHSISKRQVFMYSTGTSSLT